MHPACLTRWVHVSAAQVVDQECPNVDAHANTHAHRLEPTSTSKRPRLVCAGSGDADKNGILEGVKHSDARVEKWVQWSAANVTSPVVIMVDACVKLGLRYGKFSNSDVEAHATKFLGMIHEESEKFSYLGSQQVSARCSKSTFETMKRWERFQMSVDGGTKSKYKNTGIFGAVCHHGVLRDAINMKVSPF